MNTINKIIAYKTDIQNTANIIEMFSNSINVHIKGINSKCLHINEFFKNGISKDTDAIITLGILRGTGHLLKEAASKNINRYYIDHAYFEPGYEGDSWLRISKNKHTINYMKDVSSFRWDKYFSKKNPISPWKKNNQRGGNILIIPPTNAICWYFNSYDWEKNIINFLSKNLKNEDFKKVKIRVKPNEPIVDKNGNYLGLKKNEEFENVSLEEDLLNSSIVIAYNSQVALDATLRGIPVIVDNHNSCFELSFKLIDLLKGLNNPVFEIEPDRLRLCKWLSYCQFKLDEIKSGFAWKTINNFQN